MKIQERMQQVEKMVAENPTALSIAIPVETLAVLLGYCKDREEIKKSEMKWRTKANWYEEAYKSARAQLRGRNKQHV